MIRASNLCGLIEREKVTFSLSHFFQILIFIFFFMHHPIESAFCKHTIQVGYFEATKKDEAYNFREVETVF
jgi:hypothetical protein